MPIKKESRTFYIRVINHTTMSKLTARQEDICTYTGIFGALLAATCLIQHIVISTDHWLVFVLLGIYAFSITAFILLALQKSIAPVLLIAAGVFAGVSEVILLKSFVFSLVVLLLFLYTAAVVVILYIERFPEKLKAKALAKYEEELAWEGKI